MVAYTQVIAATTGIDPRRLRMEYCSAAEGAKFQAIVEEFSDLIGPMGPNPLKKLAEENFKKEQEKARIKAEALKKASAAKQTAPAEKQTAPATKQSAPANKASVAQKAPAKKS